MSETNFLNLPLHFGRYQRLAATSWRRIWIPDNLLLAQLDRIIQVAIGWGNMHFHAFQIGDARYGVPNEDWVSPDGLKDDSRFDLAAVLRGSPQQFD